jgi:hypothetical protein
VVADIAGRLLFTELASRFEALETGLTTTQGLTRP